MTFTFFKVIFRSAAFLVSFWTTATAQWSVSSATNLVRILLDPIYPSTLTDLWSDFIHDQYLQKRELQVPLLHESMWPKNMNIWLLRDSKRARPPPGSPGAFWEMLVCCWLLSSLHPSPPHVLCFCFITTVWIIDPILCWTGPALGPASAVGRSDQMWGPFCCSLTQPAPDSVFY